MFCQVLTSFCHLMGVSPQWEVRQGEPSSRLPHPQVVDVWGLDPDLLAFVPQPVLALVLLFPTKDEKVVLLG